MSTWNRLNPHGRDPMLAAIADYLAEPATVAEVERLDDARAYPRAILDRLHALGWGALLENPDIHRLTALNALTASVAGSLAITVGVHALALLPVYIAGDEAQRARVFEKARAGAGLSLLLTEWDHGSNLGANQARARLADDGAHYIVDGDKHLINGGREHGLLVTLLRTREATGDAALDELSVFVIERDASIRSPRRWSTLPATAADISDVHFSGTRVPASQRLGKEGEGFAIIHKALTVSRGAISGLAAGAASRARELAERHGRERQLYGAPIEQLGAIAAHLRRLRALELGVAALSVKQAAATNALGLAAAHITAVAKFACCNGAEEAVTEGMRVLSARALVNELPYARLIRDVPLYGIFDGTRHLMLEQVQKGLAQLSAGDDDSAEEDTLPLARQIYGAAPAPLIELLRRRARGRPWPLSAHARSLLRVARDLPGDGPVGLATALIAVTKSLRAAGRWDGDQAVRFEAAEILAGIEMVLAILELAHPEVRAAVGLPPLAGPREDYAFAVGWLGARLAARVRQLALGAGLVVPPMLPDAEAALCQLLL